MTKEQAFKLAAEMMGYEGEYLEYLVVEFKEDGWNGPGYYAWDKEYPEEGSCFIPSSSSKNELN